MKNKFNASGAKTKKLPRPKMHEMTATPTPVDPAEILGIPEEIFKSGVNTHGDIVLAALEMRTLLEQFHGVAASRLTLDEHRMLNLIKAQTTNIAGAAVAHDDRIRNARDHLLAQDERIAGYASLAFRDGMTGAYNRRFFDTHVPPLMADAQADGRPVTLLAFDIDFFKKVNDTYGHKAGDIVLQIFAADMQHNLKQDDLFIRLGGEEFAAVLTGVTPEQANKIAGRLREMVADRPERRNQDPVIPAITMSVGVAHMQPDETLDSLVSRADAALYTAKQTGRNRVVNHSDIPTAAPSAKPENASGAVTRPKLRNSSLRP